jgi:L-lactate utilization protein LutB
MSFRCEKCGQVVPEKIPAKKIITKTRGVIVTEVVKDRFGYNGERKHAGTEIVEEILVCPNCAEALNGRRVV